VLGALAVAAAANFTVSLVLYREVMRIACEEILAQRAKMPDVSLESTGCLEGS
jgi:hypothetical protein